MNQGDRASSALLGDQFRSFSRTFWIANIVEMLERLAYFGVRTVVPIYMVLSLEEGGPQLDHVQKGWIFFWWAMVQSFVPVFSGGFADSYGYKRTVAVSIAVKCSGYLVMAYAIDISGILTSGASLSVVGHPTTYWTFGLGAVLLALGTAIFKPGIQGILAYQLNSDNESTGWSVFYQLVNIGGFLGPFLAGVLRLMDWKYVFIACAIIVCLNYILLLAFREPQREAPASKLTESAHVPKSLRVLWESVIGICEPRLMAFLVVFSGFWFMFNQLFDMLPNFIDQWVDSSGVLAAATAILPFTAPAEWEGNLPQEFMINLNPGMIMIFAFMVGFLTGKVRSMTAMLIGMGISAAAIFALGYSSNGWVVLGCIALFSIGEMSASPTKMRYFASIAPPGKKGAYLGYINATNGFGWSIGSLVAGEMYQESGDIYVLARRHLVDTLGENAGMVAELPQTQVLPYLAEQVSRTPTEVQQLLWDTYTPQQIWPFFAMIGVTATVGLIVFDQITRRNLKGEAWLLIALTFAIAWRSYGIGYAAAFVIPMFVYIGLQTFSAQLLPKGQADQEALEAEAA